MSDTRTRSLAAVERELKHQTELSRVPAVKQDFRWLARVLDRIDDLTAERNTLLNMGVAA